MKQISPLSKVQYGIYVECAGRIGEICYNLPYLYELDKSLDEERLRTAVIDTVEAHPTLFTRIELTDDGEPVQTIDMDNEEWELDVEDVDDIEQTAAQLVRPFDIYNDRLFRIHLLRDDSHLYLFIDYHHLIVDGTSMSLLLHDINDAYNGKVIGEERMTLSDVCAEEEALRQSPAFKEAKEWYAKNFDCGDTFTQLLPDREESELKEASLLHTLSTDMNRVEQFCQQNGIFKSTLFTMAYAYLLAKFNNEQEALFNTVYNGRKTKQLNHTVGMFVKTLPVYASGCRQHDVYSFSDIMEDLKLQSNSMFAWHGMLFSDDEMGGKPMKTRRIGNSTLEASLYLKTFILNGHYQVKAEYHANEYSEEIIAQFLESYEAIVEGFLSASLLSDISISTSAQVETLDSFNQNDVDYDDSQTIVSLFERQAKLTPQNIAVVYKDHKYTYAEVDAISNRIASFVLSKGLKQEESAVRPQLSEGASQLHDARR